MTRQFPSKSCGSSPVAEMDFNHPPLGVGVPFCTTIQEDFEEDHGVETTSNTGGKDSRSHQAAVLDLLATALRKSLVTCSVEVETDDDVNGILDISCPTDVTHVSHVTFDRFDGFLGLPSEFQPDVPNGAPSARSSPIPSLFDVLLSTRLAYRNMSP